MKEERKREISKLLQLPAEIWDEILDFIPNSLLQLTCQNLISIFNKNRISISILHLFKHILIKDDLEIKELLNQIQNQNQIHQFTKSFSLQSWKLKDNNVLINLINSLSNQIQFIQLFIGPVFSPEQLEELFFKPKNHLVSLSLRFNQNVSRRSYEPFLKGSYFDNCCDLLAQWPQSKKFRSLSFVQDLPPTYSKSKAINQSIAQPIILFKFWCITNLATSELGRNLINLRFRIPTRNLTKALTDNTTKFNLIQIGNRPNLQFKLPIDPFPNLKLLDLSTTFIPTIHIDLASILKRFPNLEYLILDRTQLIYPSRFVGDEERVNETLRLIGSTASSVGITRAVEMGRIWRELNKLIETELKEEKLRSNGIITQDTNFTHNSSQPATVVEETSFKRRGRSSYASAPRYKSNHNAPSSTSSTDRTKLFQNDQTHQLPLSQQRIPSKLIILPSPSSLISICCGTDLPIKPNTTTLEQNEDQFRSDWDHQFQLGWRIGLDKLEKVIIEKIDEFNRFNEIWKKSLLDFEASKKTSYPSKNKPKNGSKIDENNTYLMERENEEEFDRLMRSKPILVMQETRPTAALENQQPSHTTPAQTELIEIFKEKMRLKEIDMSQEEKITKMIRKEREKLINFCSVNDCESSGEVVWDAHRLSMNLLNKANANGTNTEDEVHLEEHEISTKFNQLHIHPQHVTTPLTTPHHPRCAHLIARKIWDLDSF